MSTTTPSDLHNTVVDQLDALQAIRRHATELRHEYARLDADQLGVDELGDTTTAADTLTAAREALSDLDRALVMATRRGLRRHAPHHTALPAQHRVEPAWDDGPNRDHHPRWGQHSRREGLKHRVRRA